MRFILIMLFATISLFSNNDSNQTKIKADKYLLKFRLEHNHLSFRKAYGTSYEITSDSIHFTGLDGKVNSLPIKLVNGLYYKEGTEALTGMLLGGGAVGLLYGLNEYNYTGSLSQTPIVALVGGTIGFIVGVSITDYDKIDLSSPTKNISLNLRPMVNPINQSLGLSLSIHF